MSLTICLRFQVVTVPSSKVNVMYVKMPFSDGKVFSCGSEPYGTSTAPVPTVLDGYEFSVSVVQPWHGILKVDPSGKRTTKSTFTFVVKIERSKSPSDDEGWPCEFHLQALVREWKKDKNSSNRTCVDLWDAYGEYCAWLKKSWRHARSGFQEVTSEEKWARNPLDFMEVTCTDYINDQIDIHARNLIIDGTLDQKEAVELQAYAVKREYRETHKFVSTLVLDLRKKHEAARTSTEKSDPTLSKRLDQLVEEIRRLKVIESLAATELGHRDLVDALASARLHPIISADGLTSVGCAERASPRCPKPIMKKLWKAFATSEDEDITETVGPPATWRQMERLDDKVTAMMNCEIAPDTDTTVLPALASNINTIMESVRQMETNMRGVAARVEELDRKLTGVVLDSGDTDENGGGSSAVEEALTLVPPPPPRREHPSMQRHLSNVLSATSSLAGLSPDIGDEDNDPLLVRAESLNRMRTAPHTERSPTSAAAAAARAGASKGLEILRDGGGGPGSAPSPQGSDNEQKGGQGGQEARREVVRQDFAAAMASRRSVRGQSVAIPTGPAGTVPRPPPGQHDL